MRSVLGELLSEDSPQGDVVVDMEAGLEHLSRGTTRHLRTLLAVAEPYYRSMETARRVCELATELGIPDVRLVANKVRDGEESAALREYAERHGLLLAAEIPFDDAVLAADRAGAALIESGGQDARSVRAIAALTRALVAGGNGGVSLKERSA